MTLLVVTDLDGTLLDHDTYGFDAARPALAALAARKIPVVLATSKTAAEVRALQRAMDLAAYPAIVENGAGIIWPDTAQSADDGAYRHIRAQLDRVSPALRGQFQGFADMGAQEVAALTGLAPEGARAACVRQFSEPGLWHGSEADAQAFCAALAAHGIAARQGGRFLTLSHGRTKADAMAEVAKSLAASRTLALGDAPNDREMLEAADIGIIIRNDHGAKLPKLAAEATGRIRRSARPGPSGWNASVLEVLQEHSE